MGIDNDPDGVEITAAEMASAIAAKTEETTSSADCHESATTGPNRPVLVDGIEVCAEDFDRILECKEVRLEPSAALLSATLRYRERLARHGRNQIYHSVSATLPRDGRFWDDRSS